MLTSKRRSWSEQVTKSTINKRVLELICHSHSHNYIRLVVRKFGEGVHLKLLQLGFWLLVMVGLSIWLWLEFLLGYGLDSLPGMLALERDTPYWLAIGFKVCFQNYSVCQG
jgi:hypothetical protein